MKVAVVSIMKNEEKFVRRWAESCKDADYRILLDTGSTDNAVAVAKECGIIVHEKVITPWHFANARNHLLDLIPDDVDWIINLDVDELLGRGWRKALEAVPTDGSVNRPRYLYTWNWEEFVHDDNGVVDEWATIERGKPGLQYHGDKITARFSHRWKHPVHEVNITQPPHQERQSFCDVRIYHFADNTKSRGSYLPLLIQAVEEDPEDDRNTYYCARELFYYGRNEEAIKMFKRHLTMERSTWAPERGFSMRYLAKMLPNDAEHWLLRSCAEYPWGREPWLELAQYYYKKNDWIPCLMAADRALRLKDRGQLYLTEAWAWGWMGHDLAALACYRLGLHERALQHGLDALQHAPNDERLKQNIVWYKNALAGVTVVIPTKSNVSGLTALTNALMSCGEVSKVVVVGDGTQTARMLNALPDSIVKTYVPKGSGIHTMWNLGMSMANEGDHVLFLNDDVTINSHTIAGLKNALAQDPRVGLVCPHYANTPAQSDVETFTTCRGKYDGTGGMAGFAMMLASDLVPQWRFDESMKWWYGDDLLVDWVNKKQNRVCLITAKSTCRHGHSQTVDNDPPANFAATVTKDKAIYEKLTNELDKVSSTFLKQSFTKLHTQTHRASVDIVEHLVTLRNLANECKHVTEFGTRYGISTSALICGQPDTVVSYDINRGFFEPYKSEVEALAQKAGVNFQFIEGDVLGVDIEETDLLFIDTYHTYNQLTKELNKHSSKVKKYIVLHDTVTYGTSDEKPYQHGVVSDQLTGLQSATEGLWMALEDFLEANTDWMIKEHYENNNGLTVLERVQ